MSDPKSSGPEQQEKAISIGRICAIYMDEYRALAEANGHNPEQLALVGTLDIVQVASEIFAQDRLGHFHPVVTPDGSDELPYVRAVTFDSAAVAISGLQFSADLLEVRDEKRLRSMLHKVAERNLAAEAEARSSPSAMNGYEALQPYLDRFFKDHPNYERNVFVMMRFRDDEHYKRLFHSIEDVLQRHDLLAVRADQKSYPDDDDLWANIVVYMLGCRYGVAIFEDFDEREFNANVALEYGFMRALNKRVLILKEQRMPKVPSDVTANRFKEFDMMRIEETVPEQIEGWLRDIEVS